MRRCLQHCDPVCHTLVAWRHTGLFLCHRAVARRHRAAALTQRPEPAAWTRPHPLPSSVTRVAGTPAPADEALSILRSDDSQLLDLVAAARRSACALRDRLRAHRQAHAEAMGGAADDAPSAQVPATLPCGKSAPPAGTSAAGDSVTAPTIRRRGAGTVLAPNA